MFYTLLWRRLQGCVIYKHSLNSALKICALSCIHIISQLKKKDMGLKLKLQLLWGLFYPMNKQTNKNKWGLRSLTRAADRNLRPILALPATPSGKSRATLSRTVSNLGWGSRRDRYSLPLKFTTTSSPSLKFMAWDHTTSKFWKSTAQRLWPMTAAIWGCRGCSMPN